MNRETQAHFAEIPSMDISRSKFDRSFISKTTFNCGELVPIYLDCDIVPGDTVTMRMSDLIRETTPLCPVMDELKADVYFFFVPNRLVMDNWPKLMGENTNAPWIQETDYQVPQIKITNDQGTNKNTALVLKGSILDHMGIPTNYSWKPEGQDNEPHREIKISALPPRAYALIWNEFFRSEALQNPVNVPKNDATNYIHNINSGSYISNPEAYIIGNTAYGGTPCLKVCKTFDYFTAALPQPSAGKDVTLPMNGTAPIKTAEFKDDYEDTEYTYGKNSGDLYVNPNAGISGSPLGDRVHTIGPQTSMYETNDMYGKLYADLSQATGATINQLRTAFAIQKWQEREARGGQRYIEMIRSHFNTVNPDFRLQRPEYLGGYSHHLNMNQVVQTNEGTENSPLGATGAYSLTTYKDSDLFSHSFTEHGILIGLLCVRQVSHTYQQGINRMWLKKDRFDFYSPEFANLGETYIKQMEIYADGTSQDNDAFGYQERWAEMRYMPDVVTGEMRSDYPLSEDIWHYADYYTSSPKLGNKWIQETDSNVLRTLAVQDQDQFKADFYFGAIYTRPMPMFSVPGLLDHH